MFLSAGEASGDAYGAALVSAIRKLEPSLQFEAVGGKRLRAASACIVADSSHWGAIGIWQSTLVGLRALTAYYAIKRQIALGSPGLFIPIDFGFMNVRLAGHAKRCGWKVLYFVPPGSWRRDRQGKDLAALTDAVSTPFSWSAEILKKSGVNAHWFGHPLKQLVASSAAVVRGDTIAVLPGSRNHEIENNLPLIAASVEGRAEFALAPSVDPESFRRRWESLRGSTANDVYTVGDTAGVLGRARVAIVCSGTATLEAALCRTPMVVIYRAGRAMVLESKIIRYKRPKFISLPNIILDREVVPELIQERATKENLQAALAQLLLESSPERDAQLSAFEEIDLETGPADGISQTARLAIDLLSRT